MRCFTLAADGVFRSLDAAKPVNANIDGVFAETGFAIAKIIAPAAAEIVVEAQMADG